MKHLYEALLCSCFFPISCRITNVWPPELFCSRIHSIFPNTVCLSSSVLYSCYLLHMISCISPTAKQSGTRNANNLIFILFLINYQPLKLRWTKVLTYLSKCYLNWTKILWVFPYMKNLVWRPIHQKETSNTIATVCLPKCSDCHHIHTHYENICNWWLIFSYIDWLLFISEHSSLINN